MSQALRSTLKKIPFVHQVYTKLKSQREGAEAARLFSNPQDYLQALREKADGTVALNTHDGLSITIRRNVWDAKIIHEIYVDAPYVRHFDLPDHPVVVDVGGYIGDFSLYAAHFLKASKVVVYEPTAENFALLIQNIADNQFEDRITAVNQGVSDRDEIVLNVETKDCNEVHASAYWYPGSRQRRIPCISLSDLLTAHDLQHVDLLKVDCEGGEYDIFPSTPEEAFRKIRNIVFEYHHMEDYEQKLAPVMDRLRSAGYTLIVEEPIVYAISNR